MSLVAAAFSRQVQWWVLRCESSQCLGVYDVKWWRAWACLRSEYGGERCKVNSGSFDTALCHEEWVGQEKEWNCREGCSSLGPRLNWQVKALSSWWGCWVFSDSTPIHVKSLWIFKLPCFIPTSVFCFVRHTFFLLWKNVLGTPMMYKAVRGLVRPHLSAGSF